MQVHGCVEELKALLTAVSYDKKKDALVFTGDIMTKGPASLEVGGARVAHASMLRRLHAARTAAAWRPAGACAHMQAAAPCPTPPARCCAWWRA